MSIRRSYQAVWCAPCERGCVISDHVEGSPIYQKSIDWNWSSNPGSLVESKSALTN